MIYPETSQLMFMWTFQPERQTDSVGDCSEMKNVPREVNGIRLGQSFSFREVVSGEIP